MKKPTFLRSPTPEVLILIKAGQAERWRELDAKTRWSDDDFEEVLLCHSQYLSDENEWFYSEQTIRTLAFDARTPDGMAQKLQTLASRLAQ